MHIENIRYR